MTIKEKVQFLVSHGVKVIELANRVNCNQTTLGRWLRNETNISAQTTTNIAIACMADQCLAKPGMGVDEGYMIVRNEMNRVLAIANSRNK